jgi:uracil phosphoribosyltransferase
VSGPDGLVVLEHPLLQHKLALLRDERTGVKEFREVVEEVATLMAYEALRDLETEAVWVTTPVAPARVRMLAGKKLALVAILRAGLAMVDGIIHLVPAAKVGHIGIYRDPDTLQPVQYYAKLPADISERRVFVLDPMLATGGSVAKALAVLKKRGASHLALLCILAAPEGVERVLREHPDVTIYTAALDERLDDHGYIVPGLGDAGDRIFGTR